MKVYVIALLLVGMLLFPIQAVAQEELIRTELIESEPINLLRYVHSGGDYVWEVFRKILESGKPVLLFNGEPEGGLEVIFFENLPKEGFNLVGGWTILNEEPGKFFWGFENEIAVTGESIFQRLRPSIYLCEGKVRAGIGFDLK